MNTQSKSSSFLKWLGGIAAAVIASIVIWYFTHPGGVLNPLPDEPSVIDISGIWLTPMQNLSYNIIQNEEQYEWVIRENMVSGTGTINGNSLKSIINGEEVLYNVAQWDANGNPTVIFSTNPKYIGVILF